MLVKFLLQKQSAILGAPPLQEDLGTLDLGAVPPIGSIFNDGQDILQVVAQGHVIVRKDAPEEVKVAGPDFEITAIVALALVGRNTSPDAPPALLSAPPQQRPAGV